MPAPEESGLACAKMALLIKEVRNHLPDEDYPEDMLGLGWVRLWWD